MLNPIGERLSEYKTSCNVGLIYKKVVDGIDRHWFALRPFERSGSFYRGIGVKAVIDNLSPVSQFWIQSLGFPKIKWVTPGRESSLKNMYDTAKLIEAGHALGFLGLFGYSAQAFVEGDVIKGSLLTGINIMGNGYAVLRSRYNRVRLSHAIERQDRLDRRNRLKNYSWTQPSMKIPTTKEEIDDWIFEITLKEAKETLRKVA